MRRDREGFSKFYNHRMSLKDFPPRRQACLSLVKHSFAPSGYEKFWGPISGALIYLCLAGGDYKFPKSPSASKLTSKYPPHFSTWIFRWFCSSSCCCFLKKKLSVFIPYPDNGIESRTLRCIKEQLEFNCNANLRSVQPFLLPPSSPAPIVILLFVPIWPPCFNKMFANNFQCLKLQGDVIFPRHQNIQCACCQSSHNDCKCVSSVA